LLLLECTSCVKSRPKLYLRVIQDGTIEYLGDKITVPLEISKSRDEKERRVVPFHESLKIEEYSLCIHNKSGLRQQPSRKGAPAPKESINGLWIPYGLSYMTWHSSILLMYINLHWIWTHDLEIERLSRNFRAHLDSTLSCPSAIEILFRDMILGEALGEAANLGNSPW
jgi:hypothetical protein